MKLAARNGEVVEVVIDSKQQFASLNGKKLAFVRDNKVKILNDMLLTAQSNSMLKQEMTKQFVKNVVIGKKGK